MLVMKGAIRVSSAEWVGGSRVGGGGGGGGGVAGED